MDYLVHELPVLQKTAFLDTTTNIQVSIGPIEEKVQCYLKHDIQVVIKKTVITVQPEINNNL
jgi:hypothetical protein